jgi:preprotein translocase subunit SecG
MSVLIVIVHILVCLALIGIVLLQAGKGADIGAAFGAGSSQTMFGTRGAATFLQKATVGAAITFMVTSLALTFISNRSKTASVVKQGATTAPSTPAPAGAPGAPVAPATPGALPGLPATPSEPKPAAPATPGN